jgi:SAM-dependent methyltransferase
MAALVTSEDRRILEPCAGTGQIVKYLQQPGLQGKYIHANEIKLERVEKGKQNAPWAWWSNVDFLSTKIEASFDVIITNPPFSICLDFIERSLELLDKSNPNARLLFLLPVDWACSQGRAARWKSLDAHIAKIYLLAGRQDYLKDGVPASQTQKKTKSGIPIFSIDGKPVMMSGRQVSDAVFCIKPGKNDFISYLNVGGK